MTIHAEIIGSESKSVVGWVEVDPFNFSYSGPDPDGEINAYLTAIATGNLEFYWRQDGEAHDLDLLQVKKNLEGYDPIWFVELPPDFEPTTITYG